MFIKVVPDNKNGKDGYYCSLVEANGRMASLCIK